MDEKTRRLLTDEKIDVDGALERVVGNEALLFRVLKKFVEKNYYHDIADALEMNDLKKAGELFHSMKGTASNLGIDSLADLSEEALVSLRERRAPTNMDRVEEVYHAVARAIQALP